MHAVVRRWSPTYPYTNIQRDSSTRKQTLSSVCRHCAINVLAPRNKPVQGHVYKSDHFHFLISIQRRDNSQIKSIFICIRLSSSQHDLYLTISVQTQSDCQHRIEKPKYESTNKSANISGQSTSTDQSACCTHQQRRPEIERIAKSPEIANS